MYFQCKCCFSSMDGGRGCLGEICSVCHWEEDALEGRYEYSSANGSTLKSHRRAWLKTLTREQKASFTFRRILFDDPSDDELFQRLLPQVEDEIRAVLRRRNETWNGFTTVTKKPRTDRRRIPTRFRRNVASEPDAEPGIGQ